MSKQIQIYDTTLRDGTQSEDVAFSLEDKFRVAARLVSLGVHFIEGGWPGANPKDTEFFKRVLKEVKFKQSKLVAFGSTRKAENTPNNDPVLNGLLESEAKTICIFGKTWDLHVKQALRIPLEDNLRLIQDSLQYLVNKRRTVFFDAEHFFDGYKANKKYALKALAAAVKGGASMLVLCDTNGGTLPHEITKIVSDVRKHFRKVPLGIHCHNDAGMGVANSIAAVMAGAIQVQGTINGIGERCGNANLCSVIPNLELKLDYKTIGLKKLAELRTTAKFVDELANRAGDIHQAYVGDAAFAHKGGIHINAILRDSRTYEHINPSKVGNTQRLLISEMSGLATLIHKVKEFGVNLNAEDPKAKNLLSKLKEWEARGYQFEGADASFEIFVKKELGLYKPYFQLNGFTVVDEIKNDLNAKAISRAEITLSVDGHQELASASGVGPVHALDQCLRTALERFYPQLKELRLIDYKVRVLPGSGGTASSVRVLIECGDDQQKWGTVGLSQNIIQASYQALVDAIDYKLLKTSKTH